MKTLFNLLYFWVNRFASLTICVFVYKSGAVLCTLLTDILPIRKLIAVSTPPTISLAVPLPLFFSDDLSFQAPPVEVITLLICHPPTSFSCSSLLVVAPLSRLLTPNPASFFCGSGFMLESSPLFFLKGEPTPSRFSFSPLGTLDDSRIIFPRFAHPSTLSFTSFFSKTLWGFFLYIRHKRFEPSWHLFPFGLIYLFNAGC